MNCVFSYILFKYLTFAWMNSFKLKIHNKKLLLEETHHWENIGSADIHFVTEKSAANSFTLWFYIEMLKQKTRIIFDFLPMIRIIKFIENTRFCLDVIICTKKIKIKQINFSP